MHNKNQKILAIESSCDDTGVAIVTSDREILSNIVISQNSEHAAFQGVVPEIAARSHMQNLNKACSIALSEAKLTLHDIDAVAATCGPGLIGGVIVGCMFGKTLSSTLEKPFIAVNHLEGHALTARLSHNTQYPYLLLLVSGGHCQFVAVQALGKYKILGRTLDDAVGEAFDKVGKMLGLPFPGGPEIEKIAQLGDMNKYDLPKPMIGKNDCNMSFSGLKTAVRLIIESLGEIDRKKASDVAASFQNTIKEVLVSKLVAAVKSYEKICDGKTVVIAGGVAANQYIRKGLQACANSLGYEFIAPPMNLCTDNAAMIGWAGLERFKEGMINGIKFVPRARWSLEEVGAGS